MALGSSIGGLFGRSPIQPLQKHYETVHASVAALLDFFAAVTDQDWEQASRVQHRISELENEADDRKKEFRLNTPSSLFLPIPRTDLLDMISVQDRVANRAKDIAGLMLGRKMQIPDNLAVPVREYVERSVETSAQALTAINELPELIETGFGGRTVRLIEQMINELDRIEKQTDDQQVNIRAILYSLESELPAVDVMFLYQIIDWIGDLANRAQKVGGYLQMLVAK